MRLLSAFKKYLTASSEDTIRPISKNECIGTALFLLSVPFGSKVFADSLVKYL